MKKIILFVSILLLVLSGSCTDPIDQPIGDLTPKSGGAVVKHTYYTLAYSEENEQPFWVFYRLTPDFLNSSIDRTDDFRPDPSVLTVSASLDDYKGSGYDRGHLAPAADMKINDTSISESFFMSNMSPQVPGFNRGIWSKLESLVRTWCTNEDTIYIVTGPVFRDNIGTIGANQVTIPGYYYKAILDITDEKKMIALVLPNASSSEPLENFVITVDSLESLTEIDFFPGLPDNIETTLEKSKDKSKWLWVATVSSSFKPESVSPSKSVPIQSSGAVQCNGIAKSTGQRCKNRTTNANGYCYHHQNQAN
jgi:endonuclease G, mitochondrial